MDRTEPIPLITFGEEYPEEPAHPRRCTPPNVVRLGSGAACPTAHLDVTPPYPMPSFLLKKYQASRTASGCGTPSGSVSNCLPTPAVLTTNNSFAAKSEASSDGMNDVRVVPDVSNDTRDDEPPAATDYHYDSAWDHTYENYNEYDDHQQYYDEQPAPAYSPPAPAYPPRFSNRATHHHHNSGQYQQKRQQWYYPESAPTAPTPNHHESALSQESALSDWQQQLQMRQQRAPRTADFGFGATPDEERNRAAAQNRRLPPSDLKRLRKFFNNRNEHSHPTARSST